MASESPTPPTSDQDLANLIRDMRSELAAAQSARTQLQTQVEDMQRQIEAQTRQQATVPASAAGTPPAWVSDKHSAALIKSLLAEGDQPRGAGIMLDQDTELVPGIRALHFAYGDRVGRVQVQWSDLS